ALTAGADLGLLGHRGPHSPGDPRLPLDARSPVADLASPARVWGMGFSVERGEPAARLPRALPAGVARRGGGRRLLHGAVRSGYAAPHRPRWTCWRAISRGERAWRGGCRCGRARGVPRAA